MGTGGHVSSEGPLAPLGLLITGAPGSGKTFIAGQLAIELGAHAFAAAPADLLASHVGEAEKRVARLFSAARRCAPSVVILEDVDAIAPAGKLRAGEGDDGEDGPEGSETRAAYVLRSELDFVRQRRAEGPNSPLAMEGFVLVVATASDDARVAEWLLAPHRLAIRVRLEPQLSGDEVVELLQRGLQGRGYGPGPSNAVLIESARALLVAGGGCGADVAAVCRAAAVSAVQRIAATQSSTGAGGAFSARPHSGVCIAAEDLQKALAVWHSGVAR